MIYKLADLIGMAIGSILSKDITYPTIDKVFPGMFEEETKKLKEAEKEKQLQLYKAKFSHYAFAVNESRKRKEVNQ